MSGLKFSCITALAAALLIAGFGPALPCAGAATTGMIDLGQASTYAVISGASVATPSTPPAHPA